MKKRSSKQPDLHVRRHFLGTAFWLSALFGLYLVGASANEIYVSLQAQSWPTVDGTVTGVTRQEMRPGLFLPLQTWCNTSYEYPVGAARYRASRVSFSGVSPSDFDPQALTAGSRVTVHYNPRDPADAVLFPGWGAGPFVYGLTGLFFVAVSVTLWSHSRRLPVLTLPPRRRGGRKAR